MKDLAALGGAFVLVVLFVVSVACVLVPWMLYGIYGRLEEIRNLLLPGAVQRVRETPRAAETVVPRVTPVASARSEPTPPAAKAPAATSAPRPSDAAAMVPRGFIAQATESGAPPPEPEPEAEFQGWKPDRIYAILVAGIVVAGVLITLWLVSK